MPSFRRIAHRNGRRGFTYLALLFWLAIAGVGLAALGQAWHMKARREREEELQFRGTEYARALGSYAAWHAGRYPKTLDDLLEDREGPQVLRHLRRAYADPITGHREWGLVRNEFDGIEAVYSLSDARLVRSIDGVSTYREWQFAAIAPGKAPSAPGGSADAPAPAASQPGGTPSGKGRGIPLSGSP